MTVSETRCPNCGNVVKVDEIVHSEKCMLCIDPDEVTIEE